MARLTGNFDKSKLTIKDLGNPRNPPDDGTRKYLGRIAGVVTGLKNVQDARGEVFTALQGMFAGLTTDGECIRSGICYLPGGLHDSVISAFDQASRAPDGSRIGGVNVEFAYDAYSVKAGNPIGYTYIFERITKERSVDRLTELLGDDVPNPRQENLALEAPAAEPGEPEPAKKGGKKAA